MTGSLKEKNTWKINALSPSTFIKPENIKCIASQSTQAIFPHFFQASLLSQTVYLGPFFIICGAIWKSKDSSILPLVQEERLCK